MTSIHLPMHHHSSTWSLLKLKKTALNCRANLNMMIGQLKANKLRRYQKSQKTGLHTISNSPTWQDALWHSCVVWSTGINKCKKVESWAKSFMKDGNVF